MAVSEPRPYRKFKWIPSPREVGGAAVRWRICTEWSPIWRKLWQQTNGLLFFSPLHSVARARARRKRLALPQPTTRRHRRRSRACNPPRPTLAR